LEKEFKGHDSFVTSQIKDREAIYECIKDFLGKGR
jgi:hypothetical protein